MKRRIAAVLLALAALGVAGSAAYHPLPHCTEDAILIGAGSFDNGTWSEYTCGPAADDYQEAR